MNILGLDPSLTGTGVVYKNTVDPVYFYTIATKPADYSGIDERLEYVLKRIDAIAPASEVDYLVIEGLSMGSFGKSQSILQLAGLHYLIRNRYKQKAKIVVVSPTMLKKFVASDGTAGKPQMMRSVKAKWSFLCKDSNQADAYGLMMIGKSLTGLWAPRTDQQIQVIAQLRRSSPLE